MERRNLNICGMVTKSIVNIDRRSDDDDDEWHVTIYPISKHTHTHKHSPEVIFNDCAHHHCYVLRTTTSAATITAWVLCIDVWYWVRCAIPIVRIRVTMCAMCFVRGAHCTSPHTRQHAMLGQTITFLLHVDHVWIWGFISMFYRRCLRTYDVLHTSSTE